MIATIIVLVFSITAIALWGYYFGGKLPNPYARRECQGKSWHRVFPSVPKAEIREFLALFVEAFAFSDKEKLKFTPDDEILSIYRALYPSREVPDALEVETLAMGIEEKYGVSFSSVWSENLTLGELFAKTQERQSL